MCVEQQRPFIPNRWFSDPVSKNLFVCLSAIFCLCVKIFVNRMKAFKKSDFGHVVII